jgi:hypothetical protein
VMAAGTKPQKKDLLRRLVKKVLVHARRTNRDLDDMRISPTVSPSNPPPLRWGHWP